MIRLFIFLSMVLFASAGLAMDLPSFFEPSKDDLSLWYLSNIFGSGLIDYERAPDIMLMSRLFGIFNQVALAVGIIIVVYTILVGTMNTANEGKPLGEKWNSVWMPVRICGGIAMLVPKGGTGYCLAQYIVMWLTIQGIGAADTVWTSMVEYFEQGGAIYSKNTENVANVFTYKNMNYTYALQAGTNIEGAETSSAGQQPVGLLRSLVCMELYNNNEEANSLAPQGSSSKYTMYLAPDRNDLLLFGDRNAYDSSPQAFENREGSECGYVFLSNSGTLTFPNGTTSGNVDPYQSDTGRIYMLALYNAAKGLEPLAKYIVKEKAQTDRFSSYYEDARRSMEMYVNYIMGYQNTLKIEIDTRESMVNGFKYMKDYGWLLAGNYYTVLANLQENQEKAQVEFVLPPDANCAAVGTEPEKCYAAGFKYIDPLPHDSSEDLYYAATRDFYTSQYFTTPVDNYKTMYDIPRSEYYQDYPVEGSSTGAIINQSKVTDLAQAIKKSGSVLDAPNDTATKKFTKSLMEYLSGDNTQSGLVAQDPILRAAKHGKELTEGAVALLMAFSVATVTAAAIAGACHSLRMGWAVFNTLSAIVSPVIMALGAFMYAEGVVLGIMIPLIPYLTFLTGVIGWLLQVVESVAAAPLVAIGLIFPETRDEIWGRAAPAYMMTLNLFLRPALMVIGFAAGMMVTWIGVEILNIGFYTLLATSFYIENMIGYVSIMLVYTGILTIVVTKAYSLINVVPNKVLHWIGDQSMGVQGAEEFMGASKQAAEKAGATAAGGLSVGQKVDSWRLEGAARSNPKLVSAAKPYSADNSMSNQPSADGQGKTQDGGGTPTGAKVPKPPGT